MRRYCPIVVIVGVLALAAPPAAARGAPPTADDAPTIGHTRPDVVFVTFPTDEAPHPEVSLQPELFPVGVPELRDVVLTVDAREVADVATWTTNENDDCTDDGPVSTCRLAALREWTTIGAFELDRAPGSRTGESAVVRFRATARGIAPVEWTLRVVAGEPLLEVGPITPPRVAPGEPFDVPVVVVNRGDVVADGIEVVFTSSGRFDRVGGSACHYPRPDSPISGYAYCEFDRRLAPGEAVRFNIAMRLRARPELGGQLLVEAAPAGQREDLTLASYDYPLPGRGETVALRPASGATPGSDGGTSIPTAVAADLDVTGAGVTGEVGDEVRVEVSVVNRGPADVVSRDDEPVYRLEFAPPAGTTVVAGPEGDPQADPSPQVCDPPDPETEDASYECVWDATRIAVSEIQQFEFWLRIDAVVPAAEGLAQVRPAPGYDLRDPDPADEARVLVMVREGGGGSAGTAADSWWVRGGAAAAVLLALAVAAVVLRRRRALDR